MAGPNKIALVTGFTGQDGTFLTRHLLNLGYTVIGMVRRISTEPPLRVRGRFDFSSDLASNRLIVAEGDLESVSSMIKLLAAYRPAEIYNLAAQSHVGLSFKQPENTINADFIGVVNLITAIEAAYPASANQPRIYQASTSEMFGDAAGQGDRAPMHENTPLRPNSPYAIAKTAAHQYCQMKRNQGHFISCGILFNHESEIRGGDFVTMKIARAVAKGQPLRLGNLDAKRDWGYAGDFVRAMHAMLQFDTPEDFVIGTGETHSVAEFVEAAYAAIGEKIEWINRGLDEEGWTGIPNKDLRPDVSVDPDFYRPNDVSYLRANAEKARRLLRWEPTISFDELVKLMVKEQQK